MQNISVFLVKFQNLTVGDVVVKKIAQEVIKSVLGEEIPTESFQLKNGELFVSAHPTIKSELFLKKKVLEEALTAGLKRGMSVR